MLHTVHFLFRYSSVARSNCLFENKVMIVLMNVRLHTGESANYILLSLVTPAVCVCARARA